MLTTLRGMSISFSPEPEKALLPMMVTSAGSTIARSLVHSWNMLSPITFLSVVKPS